MSDAKIIELIQHPAEETTIDVIDKYKDLLKESITLGYDEEGMLHIIPVGEQTFAEVNWTIDEAKQLLMNAHLSTALDS